VSLPALPWEGPSALTVRNTLIVLAAGSIAGFLSSRPRWANWQRRISGTLLGLVALTLAREVPQRARL
jgi:threonine/homoserine/homoserine lactone efflux protein